MAVPISDLEAQLQSLQAEAQGASATVETLDALDEIRVNFLGKKGKISKVLGGMGKLDPADRPKLGAIANDVKKAVQASLDQQREALQAAKIQARTITILRR